jgi:hypothetical protein
MPGDLIIPLWLKATILTVTAFIGYYVAAWILAVANG